MDARRKAGRFVDGIGELAMAGTRGLATIVWVGRKTSYDHARSGDVAGHKHQACRTNPKKSPATRPPTAWRSLPLKTNESHCGVPEKSADFWGAPVGSS